MSSKSNLDLARKYEWNSYISRNSGNESEAIRYESMSKMALMDAANDKIREDKYKNDKYKVDTVTFNGYGSNNISLKEHPVYSIIGVIIAIVLIGGAYLLGMVI